MKYQKRVVLFLDILGFRKIIEQTIDPKTDEDIADSIDSLYQTLLSLTESVGSPGKNSSKVVTQFSDSIVVSFQEEEEKGVLTLILDIQSLIVKLIQRQIICRGAISYGKLIHTKEILFGPALVDAYETESKAAMYPRVILDKSVSDIAKKYRTLRGELINPNIPDEFREHLGTDNLTKDTDEKYFIDYFISAVSNMDSLDTVKTHIENLRKIIVNGSKYNSPDLKVKYGWLKNKYNNLVDHFKKGDFPAKNGLKSKDAHPYLMKLNKLKE